MAALAIHELGHALAAYWLDCDQEDVQLWPLGNLVGPSLASPVRASISSWRWPVRSPAGPCFWASPPGAWPVHRGQVRWNPFGNLVDSGGTLAARQLEAAPLAAIWIIGWFGYLNYVLFLANLLPALPFDGGRVSALPLDARRWFRLGTIFMPRGRPGPRRQCFA